jgi:hypothetical protein
MIQERRQHQRLVPDSATPIYLSESGTVQLFDLSEGGVGVGCAAAAGENQIISLAFDLPGVGQPIKARAETAWTSDATRRAGFRFVELTEASRLQLRDWIASRAFDTAQAPLAFPESAPGFPAPVCEETEAAGTTVSPDWHEEELAGLRAALASSTRARTGRVRRAVGIGAAVVVLAPLCLYLGHLLGDMGHNVQATEITTIAKADAPPAKAVAPAAKPSAAAHPDFPEGLSMDRPGFVLQAGAMTHETYANEMRKSLEQKNFPAFVFRRSEGRFYLVAVGPYANADAAARTKDKLKALGFQSILKRWSPE